MMIVKRFHLTWLGPERSALGRKYALNVAIRWVAAPKAMPKSVVVGEALVPWRSS